MNWVETKVRVRYQETDQMGIVYHANYFVWFEIARTEMIKQIGITYRQMEEKGLLLPVVDASCQYKNSARYDDELIVKVRISKYNGARMDFDYEVICKAENKLLATGRTKHVWVNKDQKIVRLSKLLPSVHQKIKSLVEEQEEYNC